MEAQIFQLQYALDTFYLLVSAALVMWMAAGFAMLESGLVRTKNTAEILTKNIGLYSTACFMYFATGYAIMYDSSFFLNALSEYKLDELVAAKTGDDGISYAKASDFFFQAVFVATALSIISGVVAERMKLWSFLAFGLVMSGLIYPMQGSWTWGGQAVFGWFELNFNDFAGSGIVHFAGAVAALAGVLLLGSRKGKYNKQGKPNAMPGANLPLATLGTFVLWLGWFGFNGGSVLKVSDLGSANSVAMVFLNTNLAASMGAIAALITTKLMFSKTDLTMALNGALAGLVAITAGPDINPLFAALIGATAGVIVIFSILGFDKLKIDDPVGALSVHGVVGIFGVMVVPFNNADATFLGQLGGLATIFVWVFSVSLAFWYLLKVTLGIRVDEIEESRGSDIVECGVNAYPEFMNLRK